jgi:hypothetical protein
VYHLKIYNQIKFICFIKFIVHKINYEMIKSEMVTLIGIEKSDMADVDMTIG